jgi:hypothetical protein
VYAIYYGRRLLKTVPDKDDAELAKDSLVEDEGYKPEELNIIEVTRDVK